MTNENLEGWTFNTLYLLITARLDAHEKAFLRAITEIEKSEEKTEVATNKRFDSVNEFRAALSDQTANFIPRAEYIAYHIALEEKVDNHGSRLDTIEAIKTGASETFRGISANVALLGTLIAIFIGVISLIITIIAKA